MAVGIAMPAIFTLGLATPEALCVWQRLTDVIGWTWLAVLALRAIRTSKTRASK